jgi:gliding motility-associated-like protein
MTATTTGSSWNVNFQYAGCLCPGAYKFFIKSNQTSASSKCSAGRNADTLSFVVNTTGVNITTNITLSPATCGHANGGASVTGLGGTAPYTYTWTGGLTGSTQSGLAPGTYTVLVKDFAGCIGTTPLVIGNLAQIPVLVVPYFVKCAGAKNGSIKVTAAGGTGPYTYTWTPVVSSTDSASGLAPGVYSVVLHDALGCAGNTSAVIKEPKPLHDSIVSFANANCKQSKGHALAGALGGVPPLTYTWSNGTVGASDTALVPGTYTVTVSDVNSCTAVASLTITQPVLTSAASQTNAQCNGSATGQATAILSGGAAPYTYSWSPAPGAGQGSNQATGLSAGTYTCFVNDKNGCAATSTYTITAPPALQPTPLQTNVTCFGSATGSATLSLSGGTSPYTYAWAPVPGSGQGTAAAAGLLSGTYTCSYSDSKGCAGSWVYTITSPASALDMGLAVTDASCGNNTGKLTTTATGGTPAYVYSWTPGGASTVSLNGLAPGTYTCHLSDANGCQKTAVATVANLSAATLVLNNVKMATCSGSCTASASVSASGGSGPLSYMWSPAPGAGQGTASVSALCAGTYTCTVADTNGCKTTKQIVVTQPQSLTLNPSHQNVACYSQANGTAGLSVTGGTPQYTYTWSPAPTSGQGTAQATGLAGGTNYTCLVQDSNGCKASQVFAISQPTALSATLVMVPATCGQANGSATAQVSGGTGAYTYSWSPCSLYTALASPLAAGVYTCVVSDSAGCQHKDTISITNNGVLPVAQITTLGTFSFCAGTSLVLNAGGSGTYSWSTGAVTPSIPVNTAGTYSLTVTNSCGSATASQVVSILSLPHALLGGGGTVCSGDSIQLRASGGTAYSWSTGSTMPSVYVSVAGTYVVAVTNSCGTDTASVVVKSSAVTAAFAADTTIGTASLLVNFADHSSANAITWTWDFGDGTTSTGPNTSHVFQSPGTYTVGLTVTNAFGCSSKSFVTVFVKEISSWILVPNVFTPNGDGSNDLFLISSQGIETCNIKLYDRWGVLLAELFAPHEGWDGRTMGGQSATDGTYYYILSAKGMDGKQFHLNGFFMLLH